MTLFTLMMILHAYAIDDYVWDIEASSWCCFIYIDIFYARYMLRYVFIYLMPLDTLPYFDAIAIRVFLMMLRCHDPELLYFRRFDAMTLHWWCIITCPYAISLLLMPMTLTFEEYIYLPLIHTFIDGQTLLMSFIYLLISCHYHYTCWYFLALSCLLDIFSR